MKLGKLENGQMTLVDVEDGIEVTKKKNKRTELQLYAQGFKKVCLVDGEGEESWYDHGDFFIQMWNPVVEQEQEE